MKLLALPLGLKLRSGLVYLDKTCGNCECCRSTVGHLRACWRTGFLPSPEKGPDLAHVRVATSRHPDCPGWEPRWQSARGAQK